jgi:hypothetical protein
VAAVHGAGRLADAQVGAVDREAGRDLRQRQRRRLRVKSQRRRFTADMRYSASTSQFSSENSEVPMISRLHW